MLCIFLAFSIIATLTDDMHSIEQLSLNRSDVSLVQWYSHYSVDNYTMIGENGWEHAFIYYNYPLGIYNPELSFASFHEFIYANNTLMHPDNHITSDGKNILKELKQHSESGNVYLILTDYYLIVKGNVFFGQLTTEELEQYYELNYLNRIFTSISETGEELPIYWVI